MQREVSPCRIQEEIRKFISENFIVQDDGALKEEDSLLEKGIIDSTGVLELIAYVEEVYAISVEDEEMIPENLDSIRNLVHFIMKKMNTEEEKLNAVAAAGSI